jgi:ABC-type transport system involved in multi-copper enzyme maturation permease subunit
MTAMGRLLTITRHTLHETVRRRILLAALLGGLAFLALFGFGIHAIAANLDRHAGRVAVAERRMLLNLFTLAGLYAVNFLTVMTAVLLPLDALSGEIASGVMQTVAAKPVRRVEILLGKWLGHWLAVAGYLALLAGGVLGLARWRAEAILPGVHVGLPLMLLEATVLVSLVIALGTRFATVTNGVVAFGLFGLAFIGNWTEQIGTLAGNDAARQLGTAASLLMPTEAMWQLAAYHMQPPLMRELQMSPFSPASVPNAAMVAWAAGYALAAVLLGVASFRKRPL